MYIRPFGGEFAANELAAATSFTLLLVNKQKFVHISYFTRMNFSPSPSYLSPLTLCAERCHIEKAVTWRCLFHFVPSLSLCSLSVCTKTQKCKLQDTRNDRRAASVTLSLSLYLCDLQLVTYRKESPSERERDHCVTHG